MKASIPYWSLQTSYLIKSSLCIRGILLFHMVVIIKFYKKRYIIQGHKNNILGMCVTYVVHIQKIKDIFVISYKRMM